MGSEGREGIVREVWYCVRPGHTILMVRGREADKIRLQVPVTMEGSVGHPHPFFWAFYRLLRSTPSGP